MGEALLAQTVKNPPAMWETWVQSLHWEDPLEKGMATHSSILAWRTPMDRGAWWATHSPWVTKCQAQLSDQAHTKMGFLMASDEAYLVIILEQISPISQS